MEILDQPKGIGPAHTQSHNYYRHEHDVLPNRRIATATNLRSSLINLFYIMHTRIRNSLFTIPLDFYFE